MKIIFYRASTGNLFDKLVSKIDGGIYSHVEIVVDETPTHWVTIGSSNRDGGVRAGFFSKSDHWDIVEISESLKDGTPYLGHGYDWIGLLTTVWGWWPNCKNRWVCSAFVAKLAGLPSPKEWGVQDIYEWAQRHAIRME